ncbi:MAG: HYR domain-containing protein, partial [Halobacteriales archaeon]|nr:HYR domain-containing protein [Halobacteriales archaeon]
MSVGSLIEGDNFIEVVVTDVSGRFTAQTHRIERRLNTPPTLTVPSGFTAEATGPDGAVVIWEATASDAEDGALIPTCSPEPGSLLSLGSTTVDCFVTDTGGLSADGQFTVTVVDTTPPDLACPVLEAVVACTTPGPDLRPLVGAFDLVTPEASLIFQQSPAAGTELGLGAHPLTITVVDEAGNAASCSSTFQVLNDEPGISLVGEPWSVGEGGETMLEALGLDPEQGPVDYFWDIGGSGFVSGASTATFSAVGADGPETVSVIAMAVDRCGLSSQTSGVVTIENLPPEIVSIVATELPVRLGDPVEATTTFTDPGTPDSHTVTWNWGDGIAPEPGVIEQEAGAGSSTANHTYAEPGVYTITVTVTDDDG